MLAIIGMLSCVFGFMLQVKTLDVKGAGTEKRVLSFELVEFIQQKLASNRM